MEVRGHRRRGGRAEPVAMMMSCTGSPSSVISQLLSSLPTTHPCFHLKKRENRVFFKISPLAFRVPLLNANANVNTNTLIKNMWKENTNLLFCNLPPGARCYTETNKNAGHPVRSWRIRFAYYSKTCFQK